MKVSLSDLIISQSRIRFGGMVFYRVPIGVMRLWCLSPKDSKWSCDNVQLYSLFWSRTSEYKHQNLMSWGVLWWDAPLWCPGALCLTTETWWVRASRISSSITVWCNFHVHKRVKLLLPTFYEGNSLPLRQCPANNVKYFHGLHNSRWAKSYAFQWNFQS